MTKIKGENEKLLCDALNEIYPGLWEQEVKAIDGRKYKVDVACKKHKVAIEIEGGVFTQGRHNRPIGFLNDMKKYNLLVLEGWRLLRYPPEIVRKQPWRIRADLHKLIGAPTNGQATLNCCDIIASVGLPMIKQVKL